MTEVHPIWKSHDAEYVRDKAESLLEKYPHSVPVIITYEDHHKKYIIPRELTMGQLQIFIRKNIKLSPEVALFIFVNNVLPATSSTAEDVYNEHTRDGFLYLTVSKENTFG